MIILKQEKWVRDQNKLSPYFLIVNRKDKKCKGCVLYYNNQCLNYDDYEVGNCQDGIWKNSFIEVWKL